MCCGLVPIPPRETGTVRPGPKSVDAIAAPAAPATTRRASDGPRPITGRAVLIYMLAFFGVIIAVNVVMMKLAIDTMPGLEVESSYSAGKAYNAEIAAAREQSARAWHVAGHVQHHEDGRTFLEVEARDRAGAPITGLMFSAELERPIDRRADRRLALTERGAGIYSGEASDLAPGQWELVLQAERGSERVFLSKNRIELP